jgi:hypothetical protein
MIIKKHVKEKDRLKGISLGLEYSYRAIQIGKQFVIYQMSNGKIVERVPYSPINIINEDNAMKRLYEINNLEKAVDKETIRTIDSEK